MDETNIPEVTHSGGIKDAIISYLPLVFLIIIIYFIVKLYIKLSRYLDRKNKQD